MDTPDNCLEKCYLCHQLDNFEKAFDPKAISEDNFEKSFDRKAIGENKDLTKKFFSIIEIPIPNSSRKIMLEKVELRCLEHLKYLRCSYCQNYFPPLNFTQSLKGSYPVILCPIHKYMKRCQRCGLWMSFKGCSVCTSKYRQPAQRTVTSNNQTFPERLPNSKYYRGGVCSEKNIRKWVLDKMARSNLARSAANPTQSNRDNQHNQYNQYNQPKSMISKNQKSSTDPGSGINYPLRRTQSLSNCSFIESEDGGLHNLQLDLMPTLNGY